MIRMCFQEITDGNEADRLVRKKIWLPIWKGELRVGDEGHTYEWRICFCFFVKNEIKERGKQLWEPGWRKLGHWGCVCPWGIQQSFFSIFASQLLWGEQLAGHILPTPMSSPAKSPRNYCQGSRNYCLRFLKWWAPNKPFLPIRWLL